MIENILSRINNIMLILPNHGYKLYKSRLKKCSNIQFVFAESAADTHLSVLKYLVDKKDPNFIKSIKNSQDFFHEIYNFILKENLINFDEIIIENFHSIAGYRNADNVLGWQWHEVKELEFYKKPIYFSENFLYKGKELEFEAVTSFELATQIENNCPIGNPNRDYYEIFKN